jgi:hypothetical protein
MEDKVFFLFDKGKDFFQIDSLRHWNKVVLVFTDRSSGIEKFSHRGYVSSFVGFWA